MMSKSHFMLTLVTIGGLLATGCARKSETAKQVKIIPVKVITVSQSAADADRNYVGTVEESAASALSFSSMGTVEKVLADEGQKVQKGQLMATLNSATMQNAYEVSKSSLIQAQDAYDRLAKLYANGSIPDIKFVEVETGLQQAKAMEAVGKKNLDDCNLYAPIGGVVSERSLEAGDNVMPNAPVFKIVVIDKVNVKVAIPEGEIGGTQVGQDATVKVPALDDEVFTGKVEKKGVAANPVSRTYDIRIGVENRHLRLMPGMVCKVRIAQETAVQQVVVPNRAVQVSPGGKYFVWLAENDAAKRRWIEVGALTDFGVVVKTGLAAGDRVIVEGCRKVSEGMKIAVNQ